MSGTAPVGWSYERYLGAKISVDDRAFNRPVLDALRRALAARPGKAPLRVLELGGGSGTMARRAIDWGLLTRAEYTLLDADAALLERALESLQAWAKGAGLAAERSTPAALRLHEESGSPDVRIDTIAADIVEFLATPREPTVDLLVASAFLDLVELPRVLPQLLSLLAPGGLFWFPINFDGETVFEPSHPLDEALMAAYHRSMDERVRYGRPAGASRTGRKLFHALAAAGASIDAAGSSDWVVHGRDGGYPEDEAYFLGCILATIEEALRQRTDVSEPDLTEWLGARREQLDQATLVYIAHQLDFVGGLAPSGGSTHPTRP